MAVTQGGFNIGEGLLASIAAAALLVVASLFGPAAAAADVPGNGRAWELVTPAEPIAAAVGGVQRISPDGSRIIYNTGGSLSGAPAGDLEATNLAARGSDGWSSSPLGVPYSVKTMQFAVLGSATRPLAYDPDLEPTLWTAAEPLAPGAPPEGSTGIYRVEPDGALTALANLGQGEGEFVGASEDAIHVVFANSIHLLPGDAGRVSGRSIYEVVGAATRLVDVDSSGNLLSACGSAVSALGGVSRSGERIFFTTNPGLECAQPSHVYLREGGSETVEVSASQCTRPDCGAPASSTFAWATPSGSSVFFVSAQQLTNADHDELSDLYRYDVDDGDLSQVSAEAPGANGAVKPDWVRASPDGSRVYFTANGRLLPGQGSEEGENLYFADAGGLRFVAAVGELELQISGDGRVALLATTTGLDAEDSDGHSDVYLWSAGAGTLTRLSQGGSADNGDFDARISSPLSSQAVIVNRSGPYRALSDDGTRAFFSTPEPLLPEDRNEVADVYEWSGGELGLVSSGEGSEPAEFAGASADGQTVLFKTTAALLPVDRDGTARDLYAARRGGGFPFAPGPAAESCPDPCPSTPRPRLAREAATAKAGDPARRGRLRLLRVDRRAGIGISSGDPLKVEVRVPAPGLVSGLATMPGGKHELVAARGNAGAVRAGAVVLALRATPAARARLRRLETLRVRLVLRQGELSLSRELTLQSGGRR